MIRYIQFFILTSFFLLPASSFAQNTDFVMDERDGNVYLVAKFKATWWMCQNLKYDIGEGSDCYNNDETNCMLQGRLYDQATANKACPEGYHLPSDDDWKALESYLGISDDELDKKQVRSSGEIGKYLRAGGGIGFDAELMGMISPRGNSIQSGEKAYFWSSSERDNYGWVRIISSNNDGVDRRMIDSRHMLSVRCIKYGTEEAPTKVIQSEKKETNTEARPKADKQDRNRDGQQRPKNQPEKREKSGKEDPGGN